MAVRTRSLVSIIKKYGWSLKRKWQKKNRIPYKEIVRNLLQMEKNELQISEVIDNYLYPEKSKSKHCQLDGCGQRIRYEYVLKSKKTDEEKIVGSTCVWVVMGFSEVEKVRFGKLDNAVRDYFSAQQWKKEHADLWSKLERLKNENFTEFTPFWEELDYVALCQEDTDYIAQIDVDSLIKVREEKRRRDAEREAELKRIWKANKEERERIDAEYTKVINALDSLITLYPNNTFYPDLKKRSLLYRLSPRQIKCVKVDYNKHWYNTKIKGTKFDLPDFETIVKDFAAKCSIVLGSLGFEKQISDAIKFAKSSKLDLAWKIYRVKHEIVS